MNLETRFEAIQRSIAQNPEAGKEEKERLLELRKEAEKLENSSFPAFLRERFSEKADNADRGRQLCDCDLITCDLKNGIIPTGIENIIRHNDVRFKNYGTVREEVENYIVERGHGEPILREIIEEWDSRKAEIEQQAVELHQDVSQEPGATNE